MDLGLAGAVVVITGASGGIGRALAETFAAEGARLVLTGNAAFAELEAWARDVGLRDALAVRADTTDAAAMEAVFDAAVTRFSRVDAAIANAGRWTPEHALVHRASPERIRANVETNLLGTMWTARGFFRALERTGPRPDGRGASLVLVGSTAGRFGEKGHAEYAASKAGLRGLMLTLKNEIVDLDPFGRVNLIEPGWTVTHMARATLDEPGTIARVVRTMPLRQLGRAVDVARAALFLCSPLAARHVSGETITVAGGMEGRTQWDPTAVDEAAIRARARDPR
jgi:3-oxoacyl-[acyl-carrier protein] reductase